jgi:hypothetical protein
MFIPGTIGSIAELLHRCRTQAAHMPPIGKVRGLRNFKLLCHDYVHLFFLAQPYFSSTFWPSHEERLKEASTPQRRWTRIQSHFIFWKQLSKGASDASVFLSIPRHERNMHTYSSFKISTAPHMPLPAGGVQIVGLPFFSLPVLRDCTLSDECAGSSDICLIVRFCLVRSYLHSCAIALLCLLLVS